MNAGSTPTPLSPIGPGTVRQTPCGPIDMGQHRSAADHSMVGVRPGRGKKRGWCCGRRSRNVSTRTSTSSTATSSSVRFGKRSFLARRGSVRGAAEPRSTAGTLRCCGTYDIFCLCVARARPVPLFSRSPNFFRDSRSGLHSCRCGVDCAP